MAGTTGDKTVNKVAFCSAIFAGFAYVGYSVVRTAFCRKLGRRESEGHHHDEHRLYFRRLSQTTQTDILLGNLDMTGSGKVLLRPLTVQERIRDLNLRARMFTDTMLAIQCSGGGPSPRHSPVPGPRSLQCSPWSSPRILSPVDVRHFLASRSSENLSVLTCHAADVVGSPLRRRWTRRSLRPATLKHRAAADGRSETDVEVRKEAEQLLRDGEDELRSRLETLVDRDRVITRHEAKSLVALLHSNDELLLERTITTIGNCGTFAANQDTLREVGCLYRLQNLLMCPKPNVQLAVVKALGNLALNQENQKELKEAIPLMLTFVNNKEQFSEKLVISALMTLSNIAVLPDWHDEFYPVLHQLNSLIDTGSPQSKLQALKLLVNLSCNEDMVPSLLAAQAPRRLIYLLDPSANEEILLRVVTLLANLTTVAKEQKLDPTIDLPAEDKAASPDTMYAAIYGVNIQEKMQSKIFVLMNQHKNEDVRFQARKLYEAIKS